MLSTWFDRGLTSLPHDNCLASEPPWAPDDPTVWLDNSAAGPHCNSVNLTQSLGTTRVLPYSTVTRALQHLPEQNLQATSHWSQSSAGQQKSQSAALHGGHNHVHTWRPCGCPNMKHSTWVVV
jgi:hypothetical protein